MPARAPTGQRYKRQRRFDSVVQRRHPQATYPRQGLSTGHFEPRSFEFGRSASAAWTFPPQLTSKAKSDLSTQLSLRGRRDFQNNIRSW
uniref:Uncharacterized protein n=1 Tax=Trichogramma kaykai TaxID=54128 RepID=A0ABD2W7R4_9HYME